MCTQARTSAGVLKFDIIKSRHGKKYFPKIVKVDKDHSWRDMIVSVVFEVGFVENEYSYVKSFAVHPNWHETQCDYSCARQWAICQGSD